MNSPWDDEEFAGQGSAGVPTWLARIAVGVGLCWLRGHDGLGCALADE